MNGVRLGELDSSDMLDVLHYMFEKDMDSSTYEQAEAKDQTRIRLYETLYDKEYKYAATKASNRADDLSGLDLPEDDTSGLDDVVPFDPLKPKDIKPYTPPTKFNPAAVNPFSGVLDAPMN